MCPHAVCLRSYRFLSHPTAIHMTKRVAPVARNRSGARGIEQQIEQYLTQHSPVSTHAVDIARIKFDRNILFFPIAIEKTGQVRQQVTQRYGCLRGRKGGSSPGTDSADLRPDQLPP